MHILSKIGLIMLVIGIILAGVGFYAFSSLINEIEPVIKLHGAQRIILGPYQNYTILVSPSPGKIIVFAYNSTSPIYVTLPSSFTNSTPISTTERVYLSPTGDVSGVIEFQNPSNSSIIVYYVLKYIEVSSIDVYSLVFVFLGALLFIVGIIIAIIGLILGRRKRT
ncbi:hypothetical protein [Acidianus infernus]|uniref:hypothetical protein n=1 Tax=Acidianus infernus TaxID=12915 RepID=UPI003592EDDD